jgi:hypothetical protein
MIVSVASVGNAARKREEMAEGGNTDGSDDGEDGAMTETEREMIEHEDV